MTDLSRTLKQLLSQSERPLGIREILQRAGLHPGQQTAIKRVLRDLVRQGELLREGRLFSLPAPPPERQAPREHRQRAPALRERREHEPSRPKSRSLAVPPDRRSGSGERSAPRGQSGRQAQPAGGSEVHLAPKGSELHERSAPRGRFVREGRHEPRSRFTREQRPGSREHLQDEAQGEARSGAQGRLGRGRGHDGSEEALTVEGILHVHRDGYGFVHPLSGQGDNIFLPPQEVERALDNDRVLVKAWGRPGRMEGQVLRVLDRPRRLAVGTYVERGRSALVLPHDKSLLTPVRVPRTQMARDGDVVRVLLGVGSRLLGPGEGLYGEVTGSLGKPGDPSAEVLSIAYAQGFSDEFPPEVMGEADEIALEVSAEEATAEGRRDLRSLPLVTIDGEDARDFDDAVYAERHRQGWRLVVAIADVTRYVREGIALDDEALRRATSVYLPDRVMPMLPERLSNGICSLRPDEDRLCMVADLIIDKQGRLQSSELYPAVMRSHARCTYNEVQAVLDGQDVPHRNAFKPHFERLMALARALRKMRTERGAIDFDLPEHKVVLGPDGVPLRMERRERLESHRLVEECMLAANEAVARFFHEEGLPSVYRFHGEPDEEKLATFAQLAQAYGLRLQPEGVSSKQLNIFISQLQGHPEQRALNQLLLRSMMQAVYTSSSVGHYGLAAEYYLHFTSPIRRYPDLLVHRLLKAHWEREGHRRSPGALEEEETTLEKMAAQSSERERAAMQVEREVVAFYAVLMMKDRVGEEFDATVSALTDFGFFVELEAVKVEGLVKTESLGRGGRFDKLQHMLVYPDGRRVRVGQRLRVRLTSVNISRRQLDLEPLEFLEERKQERKVERKPDRKKAPARAKKARATSKASPAKKGRRGEAPRARRKR